jgi:hypothetical protein
LSYFNKTPLVCMILLSPLFRALEKSLASPSPHVNTISGGRLR